RETLITVALLVVTGLPNWSWSWMTGAGENATPAVAAAGGCVRITIVAAADELTLNTLLSALLRPEALTVSCLLVPAASISKLLKTTAPLPADAPISRVVVPCSRPVPAVSDTLTGKEAGRPEAELLP